MEESGYAAVTLKTAITIPAELATSQEVALYRRILDANPSAHLFSAAVVPLLIAYVRHAISADDIAEAIRSIDKVEEPRLFLAMLKAAKDETMAMASLSTKLKLSPSGIADHRGNFKPKSDKPKPWEWQAIAQ